MQKLNRIEIRKNVNLCGSTEGVPDVVVSMKSVTVAGLGVISAIFVVLVT